MEHHSNQSELSLRDCLSNISESVIRLGKPVLVISDFDETLCSTYFFDDELQSHIPVIRSDVIQASQKLTQPLMIATARSKNERVSREIWQQLSHKTVPIILENGGVMWHPETERLEILCSQDQKQDIDQIRQSFMDPNLKGGLQGLLSEENELLIANDRQTSIELRAQNRETRRGTPEEYDRLMAWFRSNFPTDNLSLVKSGSSLSIQPKDINKGEGILRALQIVGMNRAAFTLVALGDNLNDQSLFQIADLSIGVRKSALGIADIVCDGGDVTSLAILQLLGGGEL